LLYRFKEANRFYAYNLFARKAASAELNTQRRREQLLARLYNCGHLKSREEKPGLSDSRKMPRSVSAAFHKLFINFAEASKARRARKAQGSLLIYKKLNGASRVSLRRRDHICCGQQAHRK